MPQIIACPFCQQQFTIAEDQYAGYTNSQVTCSACQKTFAVVQEGETLKAVAPGVAPPVGMPGAPVQAPETNSLAMAGLICSILGIPTCGLAAIAGIICSVLGFTRAKQTGSGRGMAIAGIIIGICSLLFFPLMVAILLPSLARAREKANEIKCQANLRQIGQAITMYANENKGYVPPDFSYLSHYLVDANVFTCPSSSAAGTTSGSVSTDYIYVAQPGQKLSAQKSAAQSVLAYEPLADHPHDGASFLFYDGQVQFIGRKDAAGMIKQLEQGINPPKVNAQPSSTGGAGAGGPEQ